MRVSSAFLCLSLLLGVVLSLAPGCGQAPSPGERELARFQEKSQALPGHLPPLARARQIPDDLMTAKEDLAGVERAFSLTASVLKRYHQLPLETDINLLITQEGGPAVFKEHLGSMEKALRFLDACFLPLAESYDSLVENPERGVEMGVASNASAVIRLARQRLEANQGIYNACQEQFLDTTLLFAKLLKSQNSPMAGDALTRLNSALATWPVDSPRSQEIAAMAEGMK